MALRDPGFLGFLAGAVNPHQITNYKLPNCKCRYCGGTVASGVVVPVDPGGVAAPGIVPVVAPGVVLVPVAGFVVVTPGVAAVPLPAAVVGVLGTITGGVVLVAVPVVEVPRVSVVVPGITPFVPPEVAGEVAVPPLLG